jgi:hypothetical protein
MPPVTLEGLATHLEAVERQLAEQKAPLLHGPKKDWRRTIGMFAGSEFVKQVDAECAAAREAEREEARRGSE